MRPVGRSASFFASLLVAACGGGAGNDNAGSGATPARGTLLQSPAKLLSTVTAPSLLLDLNAATNQQLLSLSGAILGLMLAGWGVAGLENGAMSAADKSQSR